MADMSMQKKLDERDFRYLQFVVGRARGATDEQIVKELGDPDIESPQVLYRRLKADGHPICPVCGTTYVEEGHCENLEAKTSGRRARRGGGPQQQLPPPAEAIPLFKRALEVLSEEIDTLEKRKMYRQDERFVAVDEYRDPIMWSRLGMSDEDWKDICQRFGKDPDSETFELWNARFVEPAGATQSPQEPLTKLIAIYILTGLPLEPLLERLHFAPETVNEAELRRHIEGEIVKKRRNGKTSTQHIPGLKTKAAQVAKLICGGTLRQGPSTGELSPHEQNIVWYRQQRSREGLPDDQIYQELKEKRGLTEICTPKWKTFCPVLPCLAERGW
jgi:uncharacterized Zn finger protein (UPF0148 family)